MNNFLLPNHINNITISDINIIYDTDIINNNNNKKSNIYISYTLYNYLITIKQQINKYINHWDNYKKLTNPKVDSILFETSRGTRFYITYIGGTGDMPDTLNMP